MRIDQFGDALMQAKEGRIMRCKHQHIIGHAPSRSAMAQTLIHFSGPGSGMRSHITPGATSTTEPSPGRAQALKSKDR